MWYHGVLVSILDFESRDPSLNLGGAFVPTFWLLVYWLFFNLRENSHIWTLGVVVSTLNPVIRVQVSVGP